MARHNVTIIRRGGGWGATCSCGKLDTVGFTHEDDVRRAAFAHAKGTTVAALNAGGSESRAAAAGSADTTDIAGMVREPDHDTSVEGARAVLKRAPNQRLALLAQYKAAADMWTGADALDEDYPAGLTDEEAGEAAGLLGSCYWRRCTDLRADGWTVFHPEGLKRKGHAGTNRKVSIITPEGRAALARRAGEVDE